ncbi:hypothetical protein PPYR_02758 [Photinus pyralis]|uniref:Protein CUSTOS n=1 Tax=Photinus pyralis TaxID=7054 RepID=A0A1Y1M9P4_PHOPY|nr:protein CUSTOS-like [Photinus pyralis]KAB0790958.1 hypothetical protein PPYR_02758 [Photinus pyralis]
MDSSGSDEESERMIRAALDPEFMTDLIFSNGQEGPIDKATEPSLRRRWDDADQFDTLGVTPQFQAHVAKKLSQMLDKELEKRLTTKTGGPIWPSSKKGGVKLFKNSPKRLKLSKTKPKRVTVAPSSSQSDDEERFSEAAVNPEDILRKVEVTNWSTKTKGAVYHYKQKSNGTLAFIT